MLDIFGSFTTGFLPGSFPEDRTCTAMSLPGLQGRAIGHKASNMRRLNSYVVEKS